MPTLGWISLHQHAVVTEPVKTSWKALASLLPVSDLGIHSSDDLRRSVNRNAWRRIASRRRRLTVHWSAIYSKKTGMPKQGRYSATQTCRLWNPR